MFNTPSAEFYFQPRSYVTPVNKCQVFYRVIYRAAPKYYTYITHSDMQVTQHMTIAPVLRLIRAESRNSKHRSYSGAPNSALSCGKIFDSNIYHKLTVKKTSLGLTYSGSVEYQILHTNVTYF